MFVGDIVDIAHILKRAFDLYKACKDAPSDIQLAAGHVHEMTIVLENVRSDLVNNPRSFVNQKGAHAQARRQRLNALLKHCEKSVRRQEKIIEKCNGFKKHGGMDAFDRWRYATGGNKEIADAKADLVLWTNVLNIFISTINANVLYQVESLMEMIAKRFEALDVLHEKNPSTPGRRPRAASNVGVTLAVSLVISRFKRILSRYRWRKKHKARRPNPGPRRPSKIVRVNSGLVANKTRDRALQNYAASITPALRGGSQRARSPSPDFYYIPPKKDSGVDFDPRLPTRSTTTEDILRRVNAHPTTPKSAREHYECWKVGTGKLAIGAKIPPKLLKQNRGQMQLRKMAEVFREAAQYDSRALNERSASVRLLMEKKAEQEKPRNGGKGRKWYFVAGRLIERDPGSSGMVVVEKSLVVVVRI